MQEEKQDNDIELRDKGDSYPLTNQDKLYLMAEKNEWLEKLMDEFNLELR